MFSLKRGSHLSDGSASMCRRSSLGKASDKDKLDALGDPFHAFHAVSSGNRMMCWAVVSDSATGMKSLVMDDPHRRTAEATAVLSKSAPANWEGQPDR